MNKLQLKQIIREEIRSVLGNEINEFTGMMKAGPKEIKAATDIRAALKKAGIDPTLKLPDVIKQPAGRQEYPVSIDVGENEVEVQAATLGSRTHQRLNDQEKDQRLGKITQAIKSVGLDIAKREDNVGVYEVSKFIININ
jgi:hypothetical protein